MFQAPMLAMCSVIGIISMQGRDVSENAFQMLSALKDRGPEGFGIIAPEREKKSKSLGRLRPMPSSEIILGHCLLSTTGYALQPLSSGDISICHNGQIYNYGGIVQGEGRKMASDSECIASFLSLQLKRSSMRAAVKKFMQVAIGEYAVGVLHKKRLYAFRDFPGQKPLWFGCSDSVCAFASIPHALYKIGIQFPQPLLPGHLLEISESGAKTRPIFTFGDFRKGIPEKHSLQSLGSSLLTAVKLQCRGQKKAAVLFSGGVDSSLIAKLVSSQVPDTRLFVAGAEGSQDLVAAEQSAKALSLPLEKIILQDKDVGSLALKCISRLSFFDRMQIGLAVPELACAQRISEMGYKVVFSGQGSDEIFAGYSNYGKILAEKGFDAVDDEIWRSLGGMWSRNFYRDDMIVSSCALELRLPFMDRDFLNEAMAFPAEEKVLSEKDVLRKRPLRALAKLHGLPDFICNRPKKAMQYGSGSQKIVSRIF